MGQYERASRSTCHTTARKGILTVSHLNSLLKTSRCPTRTSARLSAPNTVDKHDTSAPRHRRGSGLPRAPPLPARGIREPPATPHRGDRPDAGAPTRGCTALPRRGRLPAGALARIRSDKPLAEGRRRRDGADRWGRHLAHLRRRPVRRARHDGSRLVSR